VHLCPVLSLLSVMKTKTSCQSDICADLTLPLIYEHKVVPSSTIWSLLINAICIRRVLGEDTTSESTDSSTEVSYTFDAMDENGELTRLLFSVL